MAEPHVARRRALTVAGVLLSVSVLAPYLVMLLTALKPDAELRITPPRLFPVSWRVTNFLDVVSDPEFRAWLRSSLVVASASTAIVLLAATPAAYYTARHRFPGRAAFLFLVLVTQMFAPTTLVVGLYREFFELSLVNTYTALILTNAAFNLAFAIWILRAFFASIPRELEEAAAVDGCGRVRTLCSIVLPLARPALVTATIFAFIAAWNEYIVALTLMTDPDKRPLTVGITTYVTAYVQHWNHLFAASVIAIVPVVLLFALIERHLVTGLTAGGVK
ncbi:MAG: sugar ABC transporter permease [Candidatus Rokuibacteriota bacterium]|nr:MAG: sugar ABC transporter permease [Candidatus Rokubacteria bacterium]